MPNSFAEQMQAGLLSGLGTTDNGQGIHQPQRPCTTPESPDKHFSSVMSPDTTSSAVRQCGLRIASPSIGVGLFQSIETSIEGKKKSVEKNTLMSDCQAMCYGVVTVYICML